MTARRSVVERAAAWRRKTIKEGAEQWQVGIDIGNHCLARLRTHPSWIDEAGSVQGGKEDADVT